MEWPRFSCRGQPYALGHVSRRCLLRGLGSFKQSTVEALKGRACRKETEALAIADDETGLHGDSGDRGLNFNDIIVEHVRSPSGARAGVTSRLLGEN
jgi:hypothetical protein